MTNRILISETYVNATEGYRIGQSDPYETWATREQLRDLFTSLMHEFGRCISKVFIDDEDGNPKQIGWVFQKRMKYEDSPKTYLAETWVTLHEKMPTRTVSNHYLIIGG